MNIFIHRSIGVMCGDFHRELLIANIILSIIIIIKYEFKESILTGKLINILNIYHWRGYILHKIDNHHLTKNINAFLIIFMIYIPFHLFWTFHP